MAPCGEIKTDFMCGGQGELRAGFFFKERANLGQKYWNLKKFHDVIIPGTVIIKDAIDVNNQ